MSKQYSGLSKVAYADTSAGAQTDIPGKVSVDSVLDVENTKNETTDSSSYGGSMVKSDIKFLDQAHYDTMEAFMIADTEKFFFFHYKDGRVLRTAEAVNPFVLHGTGMNARDGIIAWSMDFEKYGSVPMVVVHA